MKTFRPWQNNKIMKCFSYVILVLFCLVVLLAMRKNIFNMDFIERRSTDYTGVEVPESLTDIAIALKKARLHSRGVKTRNELTHAINLLDDFLKAKFMSFDSVTKRKDLPFSYVCPEEFESIEYDYPRYETNYHTQQCEQTVPVRSFLTIAIVIEQNSQLNIDRFIRAVQSIHPGVKILVGLMDVKDITIDNKNIGLKHFEQKSTGHVWNKLISSVKTDFVLIGRNIRHFSSDLNILRQVREIQRLNVKAIGGALLNSNNHWHIGCFQRAFRNFTLVFQQGYDESFHDCLFCDHLDGPFIVRTSDVKAVKFDANLGAMGVFEDFFMRLEGELAVCPDSMFHVQTEEKSVSLSDWRPLAQKLQLFRLKFSPGIDINFGCDFPYSCSRKAGFIHSPCCIQELVTLVNNVDILCQKNNILCEMNCGNLLGAVKFNNQLPWELDADFKIFSQNYTAFKNLRPSFERMGYSFKVTGQYHPDECNSKQTHVRGVFDINSKHWHLTLYSFCFVHSQESLQRGINLTFVPNRGHFCLAPRNPALYIRNKYASEPFAHAQHHAIIGKKTTESFTDLFTTDRFTACHIPGRQDCLDNFNTDGNIQFLDTIP